MKIRSSFVSNSSSSSFVLCKHFMTEEQIVKLREWNDIKEWLEGGLVESDHSFYGEIDRWDLGDVFSQLNKLGIDTKHTSTWE
jgi:hypothetical protein